MQVSSNARRVTSGRVAGIGMGKYVWVGGGLIALLCMQAIARPDGEQVISGSATFQRNGANTLITTGGPNTIIDYRSFNIGVGESVRIQQPSADSRTLNRVPNSVMPTRIDGQLTSNGIVYISNASGVYFGQHALVNAAGVYAAAGQITNQDFLNNINRFTALSGDVVNQGSIVGGSAGVALLGKHVANAGRISAPEGLVAMAAGDSVYFTEVRGHMMVEVSGGNTGESAHGRGDVAGPSRAGVENTGQISARRTRLQSGDLYSLAIRMPGEIQSSDVVIQAGVDGGGAGNGVRGGRVDVSGIIDATNTQTGGVGGNVEILGDRVSLRGATIDASGNAGGGSVKIGGDYQGGGDVLRARHTRIDADSTVRADAIESGDGGRVIVWSDRTTQFAGDISVTGGAASGNGGFVEVSSRGQLGFRGHVDTTAANGAIGQLLLDPTNIRIVASGGDVNNFNQVDMFMDNDRDMMAMSSSIDVADLNMQGATVTLQATNDITFETAVNMTTAGAGIIAQAGNNITVNPGATITTNGGVITFEANSSAAPMPTGTGSITINAAINTSGSMGTATDGLITLRVTDGTGSINVNSSLTSGSGVMGGIVLDITGTGTGSINLGGASPITLSTDGANISIDDPVVIDGTTTIDTERGDDSSAGSVSITGAISAIGLGSDLTLNTSSAGAFTAGDVSIGAVNGTSTNAVNDLTINALGGSASGIVTLNGNISLDASGADTGDFAVTNAAQIRVEAATLTIDTEQGNDANAGSITLAAAPITTTMASVPVLNLTTSTSFSTGVGGAVAIGVVDGTAGGFLQEVNIQTGGGAMGAAGTTTLTGNISVDSNGGDLSAFSIGGGGLTVIAADITIDTEQVDDGSAGVINLSGTTLTANTGSASLRTLVLNTTTTQASSNGGAVMLGNVSAAGSGGGAAAINSIAIDMDGGAMGADGVLTLAGTIVLDSNGAMMDLADFTVNNGTVTLGGTTSITTEAGADGDAGDVTFGPGVTINGAFGLTIVANPSGGGGAAGDITVTAPMGGTTPLAGIAFAGDQISVNDIDVSGNVFFRAGTLTLGGAAGGIASSGGGTFTIEPLLASTSFNVGTVTAPNTLNIDSALLMQVGSFGGGLIFGRTDGTGVATVGTATFANAVTVRSGGVGGDVTVEAARTLSTAAANAAITLQAGTGDGGTLTTGAGSMLLSGTGGITLTADSMNLLGGNNTISSTGTVTLQPTSTNRSMVIGAAGAASDFALSTTELANISDGAASILLGRSDSTGNMTISAVSFQDPVTFRSPGMGGEITVSGQITGIDNADISFDGSGATTVLNANIITAADNDITFDDSVEVGTSAVTLTVSGAGNVVFNEKVNGTTAGMDTLTVNAGAMGQVVFFGQVGAETALGSLVVNAGTLRLATDTVRTTGASGGVNFTGVTTVRMESNVTIDTDSTGGTSGAGDILFGSAAITTPSGSVALRLDACADGGGAGGAVTLGSVSASGPVNANTLTVLGDSITLNGNITTAGTVDMGDACINTTTLAANITIDNTAGTNGSILLRNLEGDNTLALTGDAGSAIRIVEADIDTLTLNSGGVLTLAGTILTDAAQNYSNVGGIVLAGDVTLTAQSDLMDDGTRQNITLDAGNDITANAMAARALTINGATVSVASIGQGMGSDAPTALTINATNGVTIGDAAVAGTVDITATMGNVEIDSIDASTNNVTILATAGTINESAGDADLDIIGGVLDLTSALGIGNLFGGLETQATTLVLETTGMVGAIAVNETNAMAGESTTVTATTVGGDITIVDTMGNIVLDVLTAGTGGTVSVTATVGSILDDVNDDAADVFTTGAVSLNAATGIGSVLSGGTIDLNVTTVSDATSGTGGVALSLLDPADMMNPPGGVTVTNAVATTSGNVLINTVGTTGDITINNADTGNGSIFITVADANLVIGGTGLAADSATMGGTGTVVLSATNGNIDVNAGITAEDGLVSITAGDTAMPFSSGLITTTAAIMSSAGDVSLAALDMSIGGAISTAGDVTLSSLDSGNIGVGDATVMPGLNISNAELTNITAENLTITTAGGDGDITIDGVTTSVNGINGLVKFNATGGDNQITFSGAASQFRSLSVCADNGIFVNVASVPMTTVGSLTLNADADNDADTGMNSDSIVLGMGVTTLQSAGDLDLQACNGMIVAPGPLTLLAAGELTLGGAMSVGSLSLTSDDGISISKNIDSAAMITIDADADNDGTGTFAVTDGAIVRTNDAVIDITAADLEITDGFINSGNAGIVMTASVPTDAQLGGLDAMGVFSLSEAEIQNITSNGFAFTTVGNVTVDGLIAFDPMGMLGTVSGLFSIDAGSMGTISFVGAESFFDSLALSSSDFDISSGGGIRVDDGLSIARSSAGTLGLGDAAGNMQISKAELAAIFADDVTFGGSNVTAIAVDNVEAADVMNISNLVTLDATRNGASITFAGGNSTFRRLTANADDGIIVNADLSTTVGDLRLDGDADNAADTNDNIAIGAGRTLDAGIALVLDATTGGIDGAGATTLNALQGIVINDSLTSDGALTINSDTNADGFGTLTFLTGTTNSTSNDNISITAANAVINGTLNAGTGSISIVRSSAGAARLGGTDPGAGVLWVDNDELGRLTGVGFTFGGNMATLVEVDGVTTGGTPGLTGTSIISALGTEGQVRFINTDSSFRTLNVQANDGIVIGRSLTTIVGGIQMDSDANATLDSTDDIRLAESANITSAGGIFLNSTGGMLLQGAFGTSNTLTSGGDGDIRVPIVSSMTGSGLTLNSQGDVILIGVNIGAGTLVATADSDNDGSHTLSSRGAITRAGNVLFSAGGSGMGDTIELFFDVSSDGAIVLQNADTVTIGGSVDPEVNLTASNGSIDIFSGIGIIRLEGDDATTNTFTNANGSMSFAPMVATNDSNLRLVSSGVASIRTIDLNNGNFIADAGLSNTASNAASIEAMNITINRSVTTQNSGAFNVIVNNNGVFTTDPGVSFNLDGAFAQTEGPMSSATVDLGGSITTTNDAISFASPVRVRGTNVTLNTGVGTGDITFADSIDGQTAGTTDLTLVAGSGNVNFMSTVGAGSDGLLDVLTIQSATNVTFSSATFLNALVQSAGTGTTTFNGTLIAQGAQGIDLNGNIFVFNENVATINGTNGGFALSNSGDATFVAGKTYQFEGAFVQDGVGRVLLGSAVTTDNDAMSFAGPVVISNDMLLSTGGGAMSFSGTVNDSAAGVHNLRLDAGGTGDVTFNTGASVGVTNPFRSIRTSGRNVTVREMRAGVGGITLLPLLTLTDVDTRMDSGVGNIPGTLQNQDLRPDGVLTINGNLTTTGGGVIRLAQSVDGSNVVDNNGHTLSGTTGISSVATIVFGDINLDNGAAGGNFIVTSSGDIVFGQFEKLAVFGSLTLSTPGTVNLTDVSASNSLTVNAGTIRFQSRPPAFLLDPTNLIGGQINRDNPDAGPSIVARNTITLTGNIVTIGTDAAPTFAATSNNDVIGATGFIPLRLSNTQIPTPNRLRFLDPMLGLTALTANASGVGNFTLAAALASALPRENRFEVSTDVSIGRAQREVLSAMDIFTRDLLFDELRDFLSGRSFYNDTNQRALSSDSTAKDLAVTVNRFPPMVDRLVGPYLRVFFKPTVNPETGVETLTLEDNGGERSRAEIKGILNKSLARFMGEATGTPDPLAFRDYLEAAEGEEEAFFIVENLGEFLRELQLLGLGPREEANARKTVLTSVRPGKFANNQQFEQLLLGETAPIDEE